VPSSPPAPTPGNAASPKRLLSPIRETGKGFATPVAKRRRVEEGDREREEEEEEDEETVQGRLDRLREKEFEDGCLTSSVVKGRAASGLLELMKG
jgi:hypothetical protein